ncbi:melanoma-associated antigen B18-like [Marmota monax]|uniref:MAGE domain-containing protein n=1 Tax=Marmota monax TaxID=9995 RepID=A0A5E4D2L1_MARMO|nr:melanoma-associated antigen B18-like [Marmota monax]KAF7462396.1 hypothetical protein GHT09_012580 [Marmota monax]VTJ88424.1 Hypothetical predicted protein [Marmota monax]
MKRLYLTSQEIPPLQKKTWADKAPPLLSKQDQVGGAGSRQQSFPVQCAVESRIKPSKKGIQGTSGFKVNIWALFPPNRGSPTETHPVSKLDYTLDGTMGDEENMPKMGLLMIVLGVIFMKGNCASEEEIWKVLNMMGVYADRKHFIYGEPRKVITEDLMQLKYLESQQVPNSDPPCYEFMWGPRANAETSKMKILEFLARIHDTTPNAFPSWYEEALKDEEERAQARVAAWARNTAMANSHSRARERASSFSHAK